MGDRRQDDHRPRRALRMLGVVVMVGVVAALATGCGGGKAGSAEPERVQFKYARALFREICAGCHRLADAGAHGYREPFEDSNLDDTSQRPQLAKFVIENGDSIMPGWSGSLTRKETAALVEYLAEVVGVNERSADGKRAAILTPRPRPLTPRPPDRLFADGKALFKEMCAGCHTLADADAHGKRVNLDAALAPVPNRAAVIRHALRESPAMPDWTIRLPKEQIDSLVLYVSKVAGRGR